MKSLTLFTSLVLSNMLFGSSSRSRVNAQDFNDPDENFAPVEDSFLMFPLTDKDYQNWESEGTAVLHKSKAIIVPETEGSKGMIFTTTPNPSAKAWNAQIDFDFGNANESKRGGGGFGIHYVRNVMRMEEDEGFYGYTQKFDGVGIYANAFLRQQKTEAGKDVTKNAIFGFTNDGTSSINLFKKNENECYAYIRHTALGNAKIRLEYEAKNLKVQFYDEQSNAFMHCWSMEVDLDFNGFFVVSGTSGVQNPDHIFLQSLSVYNPYKSQSNHHFQDSHQKKAEYEGIAAKMKAQVKDLIHIKNLASPEFQETNQEELYPLLAIQDWRLKQSLERTEEKLDQVQSHFTQVAETLKGQGYWDHNAAISTSLFQNFFNMSISVGKNNIFLDEIEEQMRDQRIKLRDNETGQSKKSLRNPPQEVTNAQTKKLQESLDSLSSKIGALKLSMEKLTQANKDISGKQKHLEKLQQSAEIDNQTKKPSRSTDSSGRVDLSKIDDIFEDIQSETLQGVFLSFVNVCMVGVIAASAVLWFKLDSFEKTQW